VTELGTAHTIEMFEILLEACEDACDELGVPDENCPAPISNAWGILRSALAEVRKEYGE